MLTKPSGPCSLRERGNELMQAVFAPSCRGLNPNPSMRRFASAQSRVPFRAVIEITGLPR
jgi:hypothetical protein